MAAIEASATRQAPLTGWLLMLTAVALFFGPISVLMSTWGSFRALVAAHPGAPYSPDWDAYVRGAWILMAVRVAASITVGVALAKLRTRFAIGLSSIAMWVGGALVSVVYNFVLLPPIIYTTELYAEAVGRLLSVLLPSIACQIYFWRSKQVARRYPRAR
ncbi:DUF2569 family protein [Burkholderia gladioli]|uniref:DUF2569 family protein n=1 Tax=Burkholderia gladioli TaxID=28095 RepID=UPI00163FBEEB|nr:DUF2569 family protein [Burkholderia gladioli]